MSKSDDNTIENAIAGGVIGAALGALITGKTDGAIISALVGAAIGASINAREEAKELEIPVLYEENGTIYKVYPDGKREIVKKIKKNKVNIPSTFTLE